ncbi:MarR family winged helix-turn-helix transcriptional regulator [Verrucosispora sp. WMMD573]|uniref:MarR family winged helix-turn-helix transcriptional regulator n=1 Tax=Verrucosispora sp. WMMD573 TaxID=3015149 RepID=UPI00248AB07A|nr:MarR family winged helix-turn-helix transcriptional regulator [Verrucosispora sp. WMMD573]WBB56695.1 MarR family winged helix-turn-helix transcriptional regulator [Verrucosispora sp. WMMD573]
MTDETLDQLGAALSDLHRVLRRRAIQRTGRAALPDAQVEVLRLVQRQPGISVREAAERLGTAANTVSTLVGELTAAGLLRRDRDPADRRTVRLTLTDVAYERIAAYGQYRRELLATALDALDATDQERLRAAVPALCRLADRTAELP